MNDTDTQEPIEPSIGARYEIDATRCDVYVCDGNGRPYRPKVSAIVDRCSRRVVGLAVEKPGEVD